MSFCPIERTSTMLYNIVSKEYGDVVLLTIKQINQNICVVGDKAKEDPKITSRSTEHVGHIIVTKTLYGDFLAKNGEDPSWVLDDIQNQDMLRVFTPEFFQDYKNCKYYDYRGNKPYYEEDPTKALEAGYLQYVAKDRIGYDGFLYDALGKPILRKFHLNYINGALKGREYNIANLATHLKKVNGVSDVQVITIPGYNADFAGEKGIEFYYEPKNQAEFEEIHAVNCMDRERYIAKKLGAAQYLKKKAEKDE